MPPAPVPRTVLDECSRVSRSLPPAVAEKLAGHLADAATPDEAASWVPGMFGSPNGRAAAQNVIAAWRARPDLSGLVVGACVAASAHAHADARRDPTTELVVTGPTTVGLDPRLSEQVLLGLVDEATESVLLVTYALYAYPALQKALKAAHARNVAITVIAEDPLDKPGFTGSPASALAGVNVLRLRWPTTRREAPSASLHAKVAVIDSRKALVTSANLTQSATSRNMEVGLLVTGGDLPGRLVRYFADLRNDGVLVPA